MNASAHSKMLKKFRDSVSPTYCRQNQAIISGHRRNGVISPTTICVKWVKPFAVDYTNLLILLSYEDISNKLTNAFIFLIIQCVSFVTGAGV